jgi:hypothetical protein
MSVVLFFCCRSCCIVFFVLCAMGMLVFLNKLLMIRVSIPMYVNVANFCFCGVSGVLLFLFLFLYFGMLWWIVVIYYCFYVL